jgi:hypothetical protein
MVGMIGIRLTSCDLKIKEDVPPKGITIDLKINKLSKTERPDLLNAKFSYIVSYAPNTAVLKIEGEALFADDAAVIEKLLSSWKEREKVDEETGAIMLNSINPYVTYNALLILRVFNLPPHVSPPPIMPQKKEEKKK